MADQNSTFADIAELLEIERKTSTQLWTVINEMRLRNELPDWVLKIKSSPEVGSHAQWEAIDAVRRNVDAALGNETALMPLSARQYEVIPRGAAAN